MSIFDELKQDIHSKCNSNFYFDRLEWTTQVWVKGMCDLLDSKINSENEQAVEADRRSRCTICGKEIILVCKKCGKPPESTTTAAEIYR